MGWDGNGDILLIGLVQRACIERAPCCMMVYNVHTV